MSFVDIMLLPFVACVVVVGLHAYMGTHVLRREIIFVDLALAQLAALGGAIGTLLHFDIGTWQSLVFALSLTIMGAAFLSLTRIKHAPIPQEAIIGLTYVIASAAVILVLSRSPHGEEHIQALLTGSILWVSGADIAWIALAYAGIGLFHFIFRKRFLLISSNPDEARQSGYSLALWDFLFYATFGVMVTLSVPIAGVLLVFTFLIGAPMMAFLLVTGLGNRLLVAWSLGVALSMIGLGLSYQYDLPTGSAVVCVFGVAIAIVGVFRKFMPLADE